MESFPEGYESKLSRQPSTKMLLRKVRNVAREYKVPVMFCGASLLQSNERSQFTVVDQVLSLRSSASRSALVPLGGGSISGRRLTCFCVGWPVIEFVCVCRAVSRRH